MSDENLLTAFLCCGHSQIKTRNTKGHGACMWRGSELCLCLQCNRIDQSSGRTWLKLIPIRYNGCKSTKCDPVKQLSVYIPLDLGLTMSSTLNCCSPYLRAHVPMHGLTGHKVCDVAHGPGMKGQQLHESGGTERAVGSVSVLAAQLCLDGERNSSGMERLLRRCRIRSKLVRECLAECLGVYLLIVSF